MLTDQSAMVNPMLSRNLKRFMSGTDVREVKEKLLSLGYLNKVSHNMYGNDTYKAVKAFQSANGLEADGIVGRLTYTALFDEKEPIESVYVPEWYPESVRLAIGRDLATVSTDRQMICLLALSHCVWNDGSKDMKCFYVRGGNLYNGDLSLNVMTEAKLKKYFAKASYAPYYDGGRQEIIEQMAKRSGYTIPGADCSGFIVGLWRYAKVVKSGFDATADKLYKNYCTDVKNPQPGDLAWRSGHIGIYVGGNVVCESAGGEYGCQASYKTSRYIYSYKLKKKRKMSPWTAFGDPKVY